MIFSYCLDRVMAYNALYSPHILIDSPHIDRFFGRFQTDYIYELQSVQIVPVDQRNDIVCDFKQMLLTDKIYVIREDEDDIAMPYFY